MHHFYPVKWNFSLHYDPTLPTHQAVLLHAQDHLMVMLLVPKVLRYGEAAEAVTRVVKVSGSGHRKKS